MLRSLFTVLPLVLALYSTHSSAMLVVPDPSQTTGSLCTEQDPDYNRRRYEQQVIYCERNVSEGLKKKIYESYGVPPECRTYYTIDHFVPLSIGGSNRRDNLWPEHKMVKATRQHLEEDLFKAVRDNNMLQKDAIEKLSHEKLNPPMNQIDPRTKCL